MARQLQKLPGRLSCLFLKHASTFGFRPLYLSIVWMGFLQWSQPLGSDLLQTNTIPWGKFDCSDVLSGSKSHRLWREGIQLCFSIEDALIRISLLFRCNSSVYEWESNLHPIVAIAIALRSGFYRLFRFHKQPNRERKGWIENTNVCESAVRASASWDTDYKYFKRRTLHDIPLSSSSNGVLSRIYFKTKLCS